MRYKIFCDESNHLLNDNSNLMVNGAICCNEEDVVKINKYINFLRHKHNYHNEIKWTKLIYKQKEFYKELIDYFFKSEMKFKATLVINKNNLNHTIYNRDHDEFYYVVYYYTLRNFLYVNDRYKIYLDYKDTRSGDKIKKLKDVLTNDRLSQVEIYTIKSYESNILQLCDLFVGAIGYKNRTDIKKESKIKNFIVEYLEKKCNYPLISTPPLIEKFNIFRWSIDNVQ